MTFIWLVKDSRKRSLRTSEANLTEQQFKTINNGSD